METKIIIIERFEQWLVEEGKAEKTVESYVNDVRLQINLHPLVYLYR